MREKWQKAGKVTKRGKRYKARVSGKVTKCGKMTNAEVVINWGNDENFILIGQSTVHKKNVKKTTKLFNLFNMFRQKLLPSSVTRVQSDGS